MSELPNSSAGMAKRVREEMEKESKEVPQKEKIEETWKYLNEVQKLQELEIQIEETRRKLKIAETKFPELKNLRGNVEHIASEKYWKVEFEGKTKKVAGKSYDDALEKYRKRVSQEKANQEKQKQKSETAKKTRMV
jgi:hypothetical protein